MIGAVDCAIACVIAIGVGLLIRGFGRTNDEKKPESECKSAAQNAGPLWLFVPNRDCDRAAIAPYIRYQAKEYARRYRN